MKRALSSEELRLWSKVASTVRPAPGRKLPVAPEAPPTEDLGAPAAHIPPPSPVHVPKRHAPPPPDEIEPGRKRRITRERDPIDARIDLHGMTFERARATLGEFVIRSAREGARAVLVITGKGLAGEGLLRRWAPEWLADPSLRPFVAGVSYAHRRHGGEGALYVALKRQA
jgi:DNA-nicking Smr family endonuclease